MWVHSSKTVFTVIGDQRCGGGSGGYCLPSPERLYSMRPVAGHGLAAAAPGGNILPESHRKYQTEPSTGVLGML